MSAHDVDRRCRLLRLDGDEGAQVRWEAPVEHRSLRDPITTYVVAIAVIGTPKAISLAIAKFRERFPGPDVEWREDDAYR